MIQTTKEYKEDSHYHSDYFGLIKNQVNSLDNFKDSNYIYEIISLLNLEKQENLFFLDKNHIITKF